MKHSLLPLLTLLMLAACTRGDRTKTPAQQSEYVGRQRCAECHAVQLAAWTGSNHDLAMQPADDTTVLGDFADAAYTHFGVTTNFYRRDGRFYVRTDGPDGELTEYEIAYTFGVRPLQQYMVSLPDGRIQVLPLCWDTRPAAESGQRWFHIYPAEPVPHGDVLHWTGPAQNWNHMCAECHSTNLRKNYDAVADRFATTWSEIDVSCEACHGPGAEHLLWAEQVAEIPGMARSSASAVEMGLVVALRNTTASAWYPVAKGAPRATATRAESFEVETCGRCHSRRAKLYEPTLHGRSLLDTHQVSTLAEGLYHADGQIFDEVYEYGSFLQSRMFQEGVRCTDCHEPHSARLRLEGNALCAKCHLESSFDTASHHFHKPGSAGARCVECHMPEATYMVVDPRRDHSIRVPRPDLTLKIGVPNACNRCHPEQSTQWAVEAVERWYGPELARRPHWGESLHAAQTWQVGAADGLQALLADPAVPAIVRATALTLFSRYESTELLNAIADAVRNPNPQLRLAAVEALSALAPEQRRPLGIALLDDPIRTVRIGAAAELAPLPVASFAPEQRAQLAAALAEFRQAQELNLDRADAHLNLGNLALHGGELEAARLEFESATRRQPSFVPAWVNLAEVYRLLGQDDQGERVLRQAQQITPDAAELAYALGLALVRLQRHGEALQEIRRAVSLAHDSAHYRYVLAVALNSTGEPAEALRELRLAAERFPGEPSIRAFLHDLESAAGENPASNRH